MTCTRSWTGIPRLVVDSTRPIRWQVQNFTPSITPLKRSFKLRAVQQASEERVGHISWGSFLLHRYMCQTYCKYTSGTA